MAKHAAPGNMDTALPDVPTDDEPNAADTTEDTTPEKARRPWSLLKAATVAGLVLVLALGGLAGWLGYQAHQERRAQQQRDQFVEAGRQGAQYLTSVSWEQADTDVQRILASATGPFYDQFEKRVVPYTEVVKQARSKSVGTIQESGLESESGDTAKVLVAVSVVSSNAGAPDQPPRFWRMRLTVQKAGDQMKVSGVEFVQ